MNPHASLIPGFREQLQTLRRTIYTAVVGLLGKRGTFVHVDCEHRYVGYGVVYQFSLAEPADVDVFLANGNVWRYPAECLTPVRVDAVGGALRRAWLQRRGVSCAGSLPGSISPKDKLP